MIRLLENAYARKHTQKTPVGPNRPRFILQIAERRFAFSRYSFSLDMQKTSAVPKRASLTTDTTMSGPAQAPEAFSLKVENDSQEKLLADLPTVHTLPLWKQMSVLVPAKPKPKAIAHKWS